MALRLSHLLLAIISLLGALSHPHQVSDGDIKGIAVTHWMPIMLHDTILQQPAVVTLGVNVVLRQVWECDLFPRLDVLLSNQAEGGHAPALGGLIGVLVCARWSLVTQRRKATQVLADMAARVVDGECSIGGLFAGMVGHVQDRHHEAYLLQPSQAGGQVQLELVLPRLLHVPGQGARLGRQIRLGMKVTEFCARDVLQEG
mmetsp:Transcript_8254/g.22035  ORF Transcript_8254/g.22035 Transcript_8254/m.22035 type:complete len:201 (+) Transcript_8254:829-1431(+)